MSFFYSSYEGGVVLPWPFPLGKFCICSLLWFTWLDCSSGFAYCLLRATKFTYPYLQLVPPHFVLFFPLFYFFLHNVQILLQIHSLNMFCFFQLNIEQLILLVTSATEHHSLLSFRELVFFCLSLFPLCLYLCILCLLRVLNLSLVLQVSVHWSLACNLFSFIINFCIEVIVMTLTSLLMILKLVSNQYHKPWSFTWSEDLALTHEYLTNIYHSLMLSCSSAQSLNYY